MLLQRALITNDPSIVDDEFDNLMEELEDDDEFDEPEGIAIPWEERHGKKDED